ncbi:MAG: endonuclease VIII [Clostridiaceae bacterium]|nr:endonuclease VIII [Clostridiaceae bacterium]
MIELPEAYILAQQIKETLMGKRIMNVTAAKSPHKFAWYHGDPQMYHNLLSGKTIDGAVNYGGMVNIIARDCNMVFGDGVSLVFHDIGEERPKKHQLLVEFEDFSALSASVQMYGGLWCFKDGEFDNQYYKIAKEKPSPLTDKFDREYFNKIIESPGAEKLSAKALLATEQRIPGLGNGVLQDILYNSGIHPKRKVSSLTQEEKITLFDSIKGTLIEMVSQGGRNTEKDVFDCLGGYKTKASKNTVDKPCPKCGNNIVKEAYMGGSVYYCPGCQKK